MRRDRKLAIALLAVAVVLAAVYATGAFTSTTASRSVDVRVAGDGSAFLSLQPSSGPNRKYASYGPDGALQVTIGGAAGPSPATGINPDSTTVFRNVFTITNKGSQPVSIWLTDENPAVTFIQPDGTSLEANAGAVTIRSGGRSLHVGLVIDARRVKPGANLLESATIHTDASGTGVSEPTVPQESGHSASDTGASGGSGPVIVPLSNAGPIPRPLGSHRYYSVRSPVGGFDDSNQGFLETIARSIAPFGNLGTFLTERGDDDTYKPPHKPIEETPISQSARTDLRRILIFSNRNRVEEVVYGILRSPRVVEDYGKYRLIVGPTPAERSGWIALWVRGDTVVKAEAGGQNKPLMAGLLQTPIQLTMPDGRSITVDPSDKSLTHRTPETESVEIDKDNPVVMAFAGVVVVSPVDGLGPTDEAAAAAAVVAAIGGFLAADDGTTTVEKDQTEETDETNGDGKTKGKQGNKGGNDGGGRRYPKPPRLIPDGGSEDQDSSSDTVEDPTGKAVNISDHAVRDASEHASYQEAKETIEDPDEIWEKGPHRLYVKESMTSGLQCEHTTVEMNTMVEQHPCIIRIVV